MAAPSLVRAFVIQWWTAGVLLFVLSAQAAIAASRAGELHNPHVALLGFIEAAAAVLFLIPRTMKLGAAVLLLTLAIAFVAHALRLELRGELLLYAAVVGFVAVHGPVPLRWLHAPHVSSRDSEVWRS